MTIEISLKRLPLPCMLNQLYRAIPIRVGKRTITKSVLSAKARKCKAALCAAILTQLRYRPMIDRACSISAQFTPPDRRDRDQDGYVKQLLDCMQAAGVVTNDKLFVHEVFEMMPVPQRPGWCDVTICELP